MGLVGAVNLNEQPAGAEVQVTLYITEPGCMMGALFALTAEREIQQLPGIGKVTVTVDYAHVWGPEQMAPEYRRRLTELRRRRLPAS
jgi:metal-sulfur cluster biosynthetic enzyme